MEEVGISVASKLAENLVGPALREGQYLFCVGEVTTTLQIEKEKLKLKQGTIQKCIEEERKRTNEIDDAVKKWMNDVKEVIAKVEDLEQQLNGNKGCFRGWCPTWKRYCLCRELAKKTRIMEQLRRDSDQFKPLSHPVSLSGIESLFSENFVYFKSTKEAEDKLLEALKDDNCYIIGLYGMGGSGKTSLSIEVGKKAKKLKIFDHVIYNAVSQEPQINKIQKEIADILGLKFEEESDLGLAERLSMRLKSGERILIILDDVWAKLDFKKIGIPIKGDHHKGCKVLLSTRIQQVCTSMDCNTMIPLHLLSEEESWTLLKMNARINGGFSSDSMNEVAREVVRECKGLPIAIVYVGTSLIGKSDDDWKVALNNLRHSKPLDVEPGVKDAFTCLKLSYDYLRNETAKSIFLMCSIFPEEHEIVVEDLFRYGIGLGICGQVDSFEIARKKVTMAIRDLIDSCLLSYSEQGNKKLKMHDFVRDVAVWIASKEKGTIFINEGRKLPELLEHEEAIKDSFAVSSWDLKENWFPAELNAPKLEVLLLNFFNPPPMDWSNVSFEGAKELKVLAVIGKLFLFQRPPQRRLWHQLPSLQSTQWRLQILSLPQSTQWLTNLRTLRLLKLELEDMSFVVSLRRLEILDLKYSKFKELPNEIDKLNKLKLLDLSMCQIEECCDGVIRRCSQLEELYIYGEVCINSHVTLEKNENLMKLQSYVISVGVPKLDDRYVIQNLPKRDMYMAKFNISMPGEVVRNLLQRADTVLLDKLEGGCKSIIPEMFRAVGSMNELTELHLIDCNEIECLVNQATAHGINFFQKLEILEIRNCCNLQGTFPGESNLCNLKRLAIKECPELTSLFPMSAARNLRKLEEIELSSCGLLKHMIRKEESGINSGQEILPVPNSNVLLPQDESENFSSSLNLFPHLKSLILKELPSFLEISHENYYPSWSSKKKQQWKLQSDDVQTPLLFILGLQHLQRLELRWCGKVKHVFSMEVLHKSLPCLTSLVIDGCDELEEIIYEDDEPHNISNAKACFPNLETLAVWNCNKLKRLFSLTTAKMLPQLQSLTIREAAQLEEVFGHKTKDNKVKIELPNLRKKLQSDDAQTPQQLFILDLQHLQTLELTRCGKVKHVFSMEVLHKSLPCLTSLEIYDCDELEEIIYEDEEPHNIANSKVCFPNLETLEVINCNKLKRLFSSTIATMLPQLASLTIIGAALLEEVFWHKTKDSKEKIELPNLIEIRLEGLPVLVDICQGIKLHAVKLAGIYIDGCPIFAPVSEYFQMAVDGYDEQVMSSSARTLYLVDLINLIYLWKGPTLISFKSLEILYVIGCSKLKSMFSAAVIRSLPQLKTLDVYDCEELEEIISEEESKEPSIPHTQHVCFPKLETLVIVRCSNLKCVFPMSMAGGHLPQLESMDIVDCSKLEFIFGSVYKDHDPKKVIQCKCINLRYLTLQGLPNLVENLNLIVENCPNLSSTTISALHNLSQDLPLRIWA